MVNGVETDISTLDVNDDGEISDAEAKTLHENDVTELHRILTNPKDDRETKFAVEEASNYLTDIARQEFEKQKKMAETTDTPKYQQIGSIEWERYQEYLNKDPNAPIVPYKNKKVEDMVNPQTNKKFTMWSDDIIKLQDRLSTVMKSGKINQIVPVRDQMYQWSEVKGVEGQEDKGWRKVEKQPDGKLWFIDDDLNVIKKKEARIYPTMQKVLDEQGVLFQGGGGGGTSNTAADYINEQ